MAHSKQLRLRNTHKLLIQSIEVSDLNYSLSVRNADELTETLHKIEKHLKIIKSGKVSQRYAEQIKAKLKNFGILITPSHLYVGSYLKFIGQCRKTSLAASKQALHLKIVNLTNTFDEYLYRVVFKFYQDRPDEMRSEATLTFDQMITLLEKNDTETELVKIQVYKKMYSSKIEDRLRTTLGLINAHSTPAIPLLIIKELYLVRNSIVHNGAFIGAQLSSAYPKYMGQRKLSVDDDDYVRYKKAILTAAQEIRMAYNYRFGYDSFNYKYYKKAIHSKGDNKLAISRMRRYEGKMAFVGTDLQVLRSLAKKPPNSLLITVSSLLNAGVYEYAYLAAHMLKFNWQTSHIEEERINIAKYIMRNIDSFVYTSILLSITPILRWYAREFEPGVISTLAKSYTPSHKAIAINIFAHENYINDVRMSKLLEKLSLRSNNPEIAHQINLWSKALSNKDKIAYKKLQKLTQQGTIR